MSEQERNQMLGFLDNFDYPCYKIIDESIRRQIKNANKNNELDWYISVNEQTASQVLFTPNARYWAYNSKWADQNFAGIAASDKWICSITISFNKSAHFELTIWNLLLMLKDRVLFEPTYIVEWPSTFDVYWITKQEDRSVIESSINHKDVTFISSRMAWDLWGSTRWWAVWWLWPLPFTFSWQWSSRIQYKIVHKSKYYLSSDDILKLNKYYKRIKAAEEARKSALMGKDSNFFQSIINDWPDKMLEELWIWGEFKHNEDWSIVWVIGQDIDIMPVWDAFMIAHIQKQDFAISWMKERRYDWYNPEEQIINTVKTNDCNVVYTESSVYLEVPVVKPKGERTIIKKIIFREKISIEWKWFDENWSRIYVIKHKNKEILITPQPWKRDFNKTYKWLFFFWDDNDLWIFYWSLDSDENIPETNVYTNNWYYNNSVILWKGVIVWKKEWAKIVLWDKEFQSPTNVIQISAKKYLDKFRECYKDSFSIPIFLCSLALAWMNLWDCLEVNPALLLSGQTGCGKSTVASLLKRMLWYADTARSMALPGITPQPLKERASDNAILFLEELTKKVGAGTEELLRNIVNRDKAGRGMPWWNVWRDLRSPLWVNWERTFKDESLNNRFCSFIMSTKDWIDWASYKLQDLSKYTASENVYKVFLENKDFINDLAVEFKSRLIDNWIPARSSDVWSYMFVVNNIFWFNFSFEELIEYVKNSIKNAGLDKSQSYNPDRIIEKFLIVNSINRKITPIIREDEDNYLRVEFLFIDEDIYQTHRWTLSSAILDMNQDFDEEVFEVNDFWFTINLKLYRSWWKFIREEDKKAHKMITRVIWSIPWNILNWVTGYNLLVDILN